MIGQAAPPFAERILAGRARFEGIVLVLAVLAGGLVAAAAVLPGGQAVATAVFAAALVAFAMLRSPRWAAGILIVAMFLNAFRLPVADGLFNIRPSFVVLPIALAAMAARGQARQLTVGNPFVPLLITFGAVFALSTLANPDSPYYARGLLSSALLAVNVAFFMLSFAYAREPERRDHIFKMLAIAAASYGAIGLLALGLDRVGFSGAAALLEFKELGDWTSRGGEDLLPRPWFLEPNTATYLAAIALMALVQASGTSSRSPWLYATTGGLSAMGLALSYSRGAWVAAGVGIAFFAVAILLPPVRDYVARARVSVIAGGVAALLGLVMVSIPSVGEIVTARIAILIDITTGTGRDRVDYWQAMISEALQRPWLGYGADSYKRLLPMNLVSENFSIETLHAAGLIGLAILVAVHLTMAVLVVRNLRRRQRANISQPQPLVVLTAAVCYVVIVVGSQFNPSAWGSLYWFLFGFAAASLLPRPNAVDR